MNAESFATFGRFTPPTTSGGGGDTTPPTITITGYPAAATDPVVLEVTDASPGLGYLAVTARLPGARDEVVVYRRGSFRGAFASRSEAVAISGGVELTVYRAGGWPTGSEVRFAVDAVDGDGNDEGA